MWGSAQVFNQVDKHCSWAVWHVFMPSFKMFSKLWGLQYEARFSTLSWNWSFQRYDSITLITEASVYGKLSVRSDTPSLILFLIIRQKIFDCTVLTFIWHHSSAWHYTVQNNHLIVRTHETEISVIFTTSHECTIKCWYFNYICSLAMLFLRYIFI